MELDLEEFIADAQALADQMEAEHEAMKRASGRSKSG
jgi:hypothetical protein